MFILQHFLGFSPSFTTVLLLLSFAVPRLHFRSVAHRSCTFFSCTLQFRRRHDKLCGSYATIVFCFCFAVLTLLITAAVVLFLCGFLYDELLPSCCFFDFLSADCCHGVHRLVIQWTSFLRGLLFAKLQLVLRSFQYFKMPCSFQRQFQEKIAQIFTQVSESFDISCKFENIALL